MKQERTFFAFAMNKCLFKINLNSGEQRMMTAAELRRLSRKSLEGHWKRMGAIHLLYFWLILCCSLLVSCYGLGTIFYILLASPFILGAVMCDLKLVRKQELQVSSLLDGIRYMGKSIELNFMNSLMISIWSLLLIVPGIVKSYSNCLSYYVLADDPQMSPTDAREESIRLMEGNRLRLFRLHLSFIGWLLLSVLTLGVLLFWVIPYREIACAHFYEELKEKKPRFGIPVAAEQSTEEHVS